MWHLPSFTLPHFADHIPTLHAASTLPTPTALFAIGGALMVGAVLVLIFLKLIRIAMYVGIAGVFVLFCAGLALGYVDQGENNILPQVIALQKQKDEANAEANRFKAAAIAAQAAASKAVADRNLAVRATAQALGEKIDAQAETIRNLRIPASSGELLGPAISAVNAGGATVAGVGEGAAAVAAVARDTTLGEVEHWANDTISLYGQCVAQVHGLQSYVHGLVAASPPAAQ